MIARSVLVWEFIVATTLLRGSVADVSTLDKGLIVGIHNIIRMEVYPTSSSMVKVYWNDDLADAAQRWADGCNTQTEPNWERMMNSGLYITSTQSNAIGPDTWINALQLWIDEGVHFEMYKSSCEYSSENYTHMIQGPASAIGCGRKTDCPGLNGPLYICNYAYARIYPIIPYQPGPPCHDCLDFCSSNLCDCGAVVCQNGGTLDVNTCTCSCHTYTSGDHCEIRDCTDPDAAYCASFESHCHDSSYIPFVCPKLCGLCPEEPITKRRRRR